MNDPAVDYVAIRLACLDMATRLPSESTGMPHPTREEALASAIAFEKFVVGEAPVEK